jgi:hypothetical protein
MPVSPIFNPQLRHTLRSELGLRQVAFMPIAADDNWFDEAQALAADTAGTYILTVLAAGMTKAYCPGWPVVPVIITSEDTTDTWTSVVTVITGIDQFGDFVTETVTHTNSTGDWTGTAVKAYRTLISTVTTIAGTTSSADSQIIGFAKTYGLGCHIKASGDILVKMFDGAADAGTTSVANQTYVVAGTPDAAKNLILLIAANAFLGL